MAASLFPADPPRSSSDPAEIIRNDWAPFSSLERLSNHWTRPAWPDGAQAFYWLLDLGDRAGLRAYAEACQNALADIPGLDPVPLDGLHLTMCTVGSKADLNARLLKEIAGNARDRLTELKPFSLSVGPLAGSAGAVRFTVTPWSELLRLQDGLAAANDAVLGRARSAGFHPHVSIAYNAVARAASGVIGRVQKLRSLPPVDVEITAVELVELTRRGRTYRWTTLERLGLN